MAMKDNVPNVFHYTTFKNACRILKGARIKLTNLLNVNDVYELKGISLEYHVVKEWLHKFATDTIAGRYRYLCGCATDDVHSAWVSYADGYRGACLGFAVRPEQRFPVSYTALRHEVDPLTRGAMQRLNKTRIEKLVRDIRYGDLDSTEAVDRISQYAQDHSDVQVILRHILSTKSIEWAHEKEVRVARETSTLSQNSFARLFGEGLELEEVIAGPLTGTGFNEICNAVRGLNNDHRRNVRLFRVAARDNDSYRLERQQVRL